MKVELTYDAVGSGSGRNRILAEDPDVAYGASDSLLSSEEAEAAPDVRMFPSMAG